MHQGDKPDEASDMTTCVKMANRMLSVTYQHDATNIMELTIEFEENNALFYTFTKVQSSRILPHITVKQTSPIPQN